MRTDLLEEIGLTKSEINVYFSLLELGSSSTGKIVEKSGAASSKIYEILDKLIQKGLVSFIIKSGIKYFEAAKPERILDYMKEKETKIKEQKEELEKIIPQLELKRTLSNYKSEASIYEGIKGAETVFYSALGLLKSGEEMLVLGIPSRSESLNRFFIKFSKERAKRKIYERRIINEAARKDSQNQIENLPLGKIKIMPETTPSAVNIFKNRVIIVTETEKPLLIVIDSKEVADSFRVYFEKWWSQDTTVGKGFDALKIALISYINELDKNETYDVIGAGFGMKGYEKTYADFFRELHLHRVEKGKHARMLFQQGSFEPIDKYRREIYNENAEIKFLPYKTDSPVATFTSSKKSLLVIQKEVPTVITISNKEVAQSLKKNFETLWNQETRVVKGLDAVQELFEDMLAEGHCDWIGARGYFMDARPKYVDVWEKRALQSGFTLRNIVDKDVKGHRITRFAFIQTKYTLPKEFSNLSVFWIFKNKVAIANWTEKEPIVVIIENKHTIEMYHTQFELLWKRKDLL